MCRNIFPDVSRFARHKLQYFTILFNGIHLTAISTTSPQFTLNSHFNKNNFESMFSSLIVSKQMDRYERGEFAVVKFSPCSYFAKVFSLKRQTATKPNQTKPLLDLLITVHLMYLIFQSSIVLFN